MRYKITHTTTYQYTESVPVCQNMVHLTPRSTPWQSCAYHRLNIKPSPADTGKRNDYFGNPTHYFAITEAHRKLVVSAVSKVTLKPRTGERPACGPWEALRDSLPGDLRLQSLDAYQFVFASPLIQPIAELAAYARESFTKGRAVDEAARDLMRRIHADFKYDPQATTVQTPLVEVFEKRRGVCQDLAHVALGCLRSLGLPARYVSGYLRTVPPPGRPRLVGADASHAWFSIYLGSAGWLDLDPTNNVATDTDHITVAWGRDYSDVCPVNGMFVGGGQHSMFVGVDVAPLDGQADGPTAANGQ